MARGEIPQRVCEKKNDACTNRKRRYFILLCVDNIQLNYNEILTTDSKPILSDCVQHNISNK